MSQSSTTDIRSYGLIMIRAPPIGGAAAAAGAPDPATGGGSWRVGGDDPKWPRTHQPRPTNLWGQIAERREYLIICRKDTLGFVEFVRGRQEPDDHPYIQTLIDGMTNAEKTLILRNKYELLWKKLWVRKSFGKMKSDTRQAMSKQGAIVQGTLCRETGLRKTLRDLVLSSPTNWTEPEWGFPKGRANMGENEMETAIREFIEETGIKRDEFRILKNMNQIDEVFRSDNNKIQRHRYFVAVMIQQGDEPCIHRGNIDQMKEISSLGFYPYEQALSKIRDTNHVKREVLKSVEQFFRDQTVEILR